MKWSLHQSHCWKHCRKSSTEMLSRTASESRWTPTMSAKHLSLGYKQNGGCLTPLFARPHSLRPFFLFPGMNHLKGSCLADVAQVQRGSLAALERISVEDFRLYWWNKSKMQQLRFLFAMALLYMFRVTISPIIMSTMLYMATGELAHLGCY